MGLNDKVLCEGDYKATKGPAAGEAQLQAL